MGGGRESIRVVAAVLTLVAAGCTAEEEPFPAACGAGADTVRQALRAAPRTVTLTGGMRLSTCVERATADADLQALGATLTAVADGLQRSAARAPRDALRLGYLIGAARAGAGRTQGIALELARRLEQTGRLEESSRAAEAALARGRRAGGARG